jgi:glycosyltransferase involved in cell wall biosynthesis
VINAHASGDRAACRRARLAGRLPQALVLTRRAMPRSSWPSAIASGLAADRVVAVSGAVARALAWRGTPRGRIRVVPNAVDWERIERTPSAAAVARARALAGADPARPTIGIVARRKRQDVVLRALGRVSLPVTLVCLGIEADPALAGLARAAETRGHVVRFVPFQDDVRPFYALFDAAVLPCATEGCSQALLEAMALGVPVIAARGGGNDEVVTDGVHGLLPPLEPAAVARAIARMLLDGEARKAMSQAARRRVLDAFDIATVVRRTDAVYREALARRRGRGA